MSAPASSIDKSDRILLTGGAGFLGRVVAEQLRGCGYEHLIIPRRRDFDLTREADVDRLYRQTNPTVVLHMAAEVGGIGANRENPGRYFFANMAMGLHIIEYGRRHGVKKLLQTGTICAYPKFTPVPFKESDLWNGYPEETNAPYGIAKKAHLVGGQAYRDQYGLNVVHLLPVNLYGPRDNFDLETSHVIPALIRKMTESPDKVVLWGDGSPTREFFYVEDCAEALWLAAQRYDGPDPVNLGTGVETSIRDLTELVAELTGFEGEIVWDASKPNGQPRRQLDVTRAEELFGFRARTGLREGLERTVAWFREQVAAAAV